MAWPATPVLDFVDPTKTTFTMIGHEPAGKRAIAAGDYIVVYNVGIDPADAYAGAQHRQGDGLQSADAAKGLYLITLDANPFAEQNPPMPSPGARFQVVGQPVTYHCTKGAGGTGSISRQWDYGMVKGRPVADRRRHQPADPARHRLQIRLQHLTRTAAVRWPC